MEKQFKDIAETGLSSYDSLAKSLKGDFEIDSIAKSLQSGVEDNTF